MRSRSNNSMLLASVLALTAANADLAVWLVRRRCSVSLCAVSLCAVSLCDTLCDRLRLPFLLPAVLDRDSSNVVQRTMRKQCVLVLITQRK